MLWYLSRMSLSFRISHTKLSKSPGTPSFNIVACTECVAKKIPTYWLHMAAVWQNSPACTGILHRQIG